MMKHATSILCLAASFGAVSCTSSDLQLRPIKSALADGRQPADFRVAEGNGQLALGNVALALESYRKALREQPDSVEALVGVATCYDRMGRFDLSRRHYEAALAVAPNDFDLYALFAQSLELQGRAGEAAQVKKELAARVVAPEAARDAPGSVPVLPPPPAPSVTVALAPARSAPVAVEKPVVREAAIPVRLERLSLGEVALITRPDAGWQAATVARSAQSTTIRFEPRRTSSVTLLNAARVGGLAARTRDYLSARGFKGAAIGDAPAVRLRSVIIYSEGYQARAERLAAQFGFALERRSAAKTGLTILLGRDAARDRQLGGRRA
jgi:tetratricopeptide (TPR) repeat protein